jgi:hypothetical protein
MQPGQEPLSHEVSQPSSTSRAGLPSLTLGKDQHLAPAAVWLLQAAVTCWQHGHGSSGAVSRVQLAGEDVSQSR